MSELVNAPVPEPLLVFHGLETVGSGVVDQHTPRADTVKPPVAVTLPPPEAVVDVMADIAVVVTAEIPAGVTKLTCAP